jgi:hypothetical protein
VERQGDLVTCDHSPFPNPRMTDCIKCGRPIPEGFKRNVRAENALVERVSPEAGVVINANRLVRSGLGWVRHILTRNFHREGNEELLDFVNYAVWLDQQRRLSGLDGLGAHKLKALHHATEAYRWWNMAEDDD